MIHTLMTTTLLGMWSDSWADMVSFEKLGPSYVYRIDCFVKKLFLDSMDLHVAW